MIQVMIGDVLEKLRGLPGKSVHCVVTSPPYWGLRDYKIEGQLGLEKTPEEYIAKLVEVFREVKRVLRDDGTLWLNLADCYYGSWGNHGSREGGQREVNVERMNRHAWEAHTERPGSSFRHESLKPKDLCMIPARVALALQADGWWLRSDIIWSKRNPSPESVRDRPSKSHEYIFLLTKSSRYFYDQEPLREPVLPESLEREKYGWNEAFVGRHQGSPREKRLRSDDHNGFTSPTGRNCRSVWEMATQACPVPHLAAFPEELPERCIKAGTSLKGCCPKCGAPWERIVERTRPDDWEDSGPVTDREKELRAISQDLYGGNQKSRSISDIYGRATNSKIETKEWLPTCSCGVTELAPCVVLDPFAGSGTTGQVAKKLGRSCILIELNPDYDDMIRIRTGVGVERGPLDISLEEKVKEDAVENQNR